MPKTITLGDRSFRLSITESQIQEAVAQIAGRINKDYAGRTPVIVPILNGAFMFASDLAKLLTVQCTISFVKASSYSGTVSTRVLTQLIGINEDIMGRDVILVEDIVDTGHSLVKVLASVHKLQPASVRIASLLFKPKAVETDITIDYKGIDISNEFVVGYGLDYNGLGRNLKEIYQEI